jgi:hypothetical protein
MAVGDPAGRPVQARDYRLFLVVRLGHDHSAGVRGDLWDCTRCCPLLAHRRRTRSPPFFDSSRGEEPTFRLLI